LLYKRVSTFAREDRAGGVVDPENWFSRTLWRNEREVVIKEEMKFILADPVVLKLAKVITQTGEIIVAVATAQTKAV
jgi:hypothetical protein